MTENSVLEVNCCGPADAPILAGQVAIVSAADADPADLAAIFDAAPQPAAGSVLVAYVDGVPAGWIALRPRSAAVWVVTSLAVRPGYRGRGLTYHLAKATIGYARDGGALVIEADPARAPLGRQRGEPHVSAAQVFTDAGFTCRGIRPSVLQADVTHATAGASAEAPAGLARC
jgi:GNAT superfamily N-acetyltransferase